MEVSCVTLPFQLNFICRHQLGKIPRHGHAPARSESFYMLSLIKSHGHYDAVTSPN